MTLDKIETLLLTLTFVVPGYIMHCTFALFTPRKSETKEILLLRFIAFGMLNLIVCLPLLYLITSNLNVAAVVKQGIDANLKHNIRICFTLAGYFLVINFVVPAILGMLLGICDQRQPVHWALARLKLNTMHPIPSAWDYKFNSISRDGGRWLTVTLKDDRVITGFFGSSSFASTDSAERDLYIQRIVDMDSWNDVDRTDGILVRHDDIRSIEFYFDGEADQQPIVSEREDPNVVKEQQTNSSDGRASGAVSTQDVNVGGGPSVKTNP